MCRSRSKKTTPGINRRSDFPLGKMMKMLAVVTWLMVGMEAFGQEIPVVKLGQLQEMLKKDHDKVLVVNFWATWCAPCIKEMPLLEKLGTDRKDVEILLVSMDMDLDPDPQKVRNFVARKKIQSSVIILDERNPNAWIDKLEKTWTGALPATLVINNRNGKRKFVEKALHEGDLEKMIAEVQ